mmetsp:Transcript_6660/g.14567  ORF Transcript_6660/g.14567 Transcript_6660/m.14567 type:complete len:115 (-) Transcript_6660:208-552(-)
MEWLLGNLAFAYSFHKTQPAIIVDELVRIWLDIVTPGRGAGESNWFFKGIRSIEQQAERTSRELDIRSDLRRWDEEFPWIHHELIIRYVVGGLASTTVMFLYNALRGGNKERRR